MQTQRPGGLAGKARRAKLRKRVARLQAQCLIDEFYEPDAVETHSTRGIPIRGRSEFLPAVATGSSLTMNRSNPKGNESQLNLALGQEDDERLTKVAAVSPQIKTAPVVASADDALDTEDESDGSEKETAIRFSKPRGPTYDLFNLKKFDAPRRKRITFGGFLVGCAVGTAGAAALLLVVRVLLG